MGTPRDAAAERGTTWRDLRADLERRSRTELSADDLDVLADALFWTDDVFASIDTRRDAYRAHGANTDDEAAAYSSWRLFYDHYLVGETSVANGWLERCRRHTVEADTAVLHGWLAIADADVALTAGQVQPALEIAQQAVTSGRSEADPDLHAMALQMLGRAEIAAGDKTNGLNRMDEAMVAVINDELQPLYTGWVYCNVVATCFGLADLRRAHEWSTAATRWCASLRDGLMYPGLCRVYAAELSWLHGDWEEAERQARRACAELEAFDERYSGEAHYLLGELARLRGDTVAATESFVRASELGREPHPGLARLWAARGEIRRALGALEPRFAASADSTIEQTLVGRALVDVHVQAADFDAAAQVAHLLAPAGDDAPAVLAAHAAAARGVVALGRADAAAAVSMLGDAVDGFHDIGCRHDEAIALLALADAQSSLGDDDTGTATRQMAHRILSEIGAQAASDAGGASPLTDREAEVLRLVAEGLTNAQIAQRLTVSPHTVARHVANLTTKLGVNGRAAATAKAYGLGLLD